MYRRGGKLRGFEVYCKVYKFWRESRGIFYWYIFVVFVGMIRLCYYCVN